MKTKIGFVGAGGFASKTHYPVWSIMNDVELVAVCDLISEKTQAKADQYKFQSNIKMQWK